MRVNRAYLVLPITYRTHARWCGNATFPTCMMKKGVYLCHLPFIIYGRGVVLPLGGYGDRCVECGDATSLLICQRLGECGNATFLSVSILVTPNANCGID